VALPHPWQALLVFACVQIPLALWGKVLRRFIKTCGLLILPFIISLVFIRGFFTPGGTTLLQLGPFALTSAGLAVAFNFASRILLAMSAMILALFVTRPDHIAQALAEAGLPRQLAYIFVTTLQLIPRFQEKAQTILDAQQARGLEVEGNLLHRAKILFPLVTPLILGSILDIDERAMALEARAFNHAGEKSHFVDLMDSRRQATLRWALALATGGLIVWRLWAVLAA
jgi:energy-coupling factor transport system permease protein